jgi:hypothetical protein
VFTSLTTSYRWVWIINSRKIARWCQHWRFEVSFQGKSISDTYLISITSLLEDEQTSEHGGGGRYNAILEFKGEQIKILRKKKKKMSIKCETWVPVGPHRPGSRPSPTSGSDLLEDPPTCLLAQLT